MKKLFTILIALTLTITLFAQAPQKMSCQAVIRGGLLNNLITNSKVAMRISVLQGSSSGTAVYIETQTPTTNANGLVSIEVGAGTRVSSGTFSAINWANGPYFIKTETDPFGGNNYSIVNSNELMSVPYALFSANGTPGPQGPQGLKGDKGDKGDQGVAGPAGANGTAGVKGDKGDKGDQGIAGNNGTNGVDGAAGAKGDKGDKGDQGIQGVAGTNGTNGVDGAAGAKGDKGDKGDQGIQGQAGTNGTNGVDGAKGDKGDKGDQGLPGADGAANAWGLTGNAGTVDGTNFIGTTDNVPLNFRVNNIKAGRIDATLNNAFYGYGAGFSNTTGHENIAIGSFALQNNTTGYVNTAVGTEAMRYNTTGYWNVAIGSATLNKNSTGFRNTAVGINALHQNIDGNGNSAMGFESLLNNTSGYGNTATGIYALHNNTTGVWNVAIGQNALMSNTAGSVNTAIGARAMENSISSVPGEAFGFAALFTNTTGQRNVAVGAHALFSNTTGNYNVAMGNSPDTWGGSLTGNTTGSNNTASGFGSLHENTTGSNNTAFGSWANVTSGDLNNATAIGANAKVNTSNSLILGDTTNVNVGIGTGSPTKKLDVRGAVRIVDGTQGANKVLTSDADGNASWQTQVSTVHYIGENYGGGVIYYLYKGSDGIEHGLIVSLTEQDNTSWQNTGTLVNANRTEDGAYNTNLMTNSQAKTYISSLGAGWYLPSIDELSLLYYNRYHVQKAMRTGNSTLLSNTANYWSSTEYNTTNAFTLSFSTGYNNLINKTATNYSVRGVRAF